MAVVHTALNSGCTESPFCADFLMHGSFETKSTPGGGLCVVDVNGVKAENKRFWEILCYDPEEKEVRPIGKENTIGPERWEKQTSNRSFIGVFPAQVCPISFAQITCT